MNTRLDSLKSRRAFLVASAAAGIAVSMRPVCAQTMIVTPTDGLDTGATRITAKDGTKIPVYYAAPGRPGTFATILVIPEIWGAHEHVKDVARRLARDGYFALVVEPYTRVGDLTQMAEIKDVLAGANQLTDEQCFADLDAAVAWADTQPKADTGGSASRDSAAADARPGCTRRTILRSRRRSPGTAG